MFEIKAFNSQAYRQQTRRSTMFLALIFVLLAMLCSGAAVMLFGEPDGDNFRWNLGGVLFGLGLTLALVRYKLWHQPSMAAAVYGWQLKRSLMSIGNRMHLVTAGVAAGDPTALKLLRFYHLGLSQMHELDANSSDLSQLQTQITQHLARMQALGMDTELYQFNPAWLEVVRKSNTAQ